MTIPSDARPWLERIAAMDHEQMARFWRFAPVGHEVFTTPELAQAFQARFSSLGGMTVEMSKRIGWEGGRDGR